MYRSDRTGGARALLAPTSVACVLVLFASASVVVFAQAPAAKNSSGQEANRGKYIVDNVAMCSQCHTPRDSDGNLEREHWLTGSAVWLLPAKPSEDWPLKAPRIAGTPPGTDEEMITLLTTGIWRDGRRLRPPMPQFRMTREDAASVVAYLKSLKSTR